MITLESVNTVAQSKHSCVCLSIFNQPETTTSFVI